MKKNIFDLLKDNAYPGRGIIIGCPAVDFVAIAYFIMGRSENSRNRVFVRRNDDIVIEPYDTSLVEDPSLIIYSPLRVCGMDTIVTNGDQTDTICEFLNAGSTFEKALYTRCYEPDEPNRTPRISGMIHLEGNCFAYKLSVLKSGADTVCDRFFFEYEPVCGVGHFIHTYEGNGNPLPSFKGEPVRIGIPECIDEFTDNLWASLDSDNRIALYTRYIDIGSGKYEDRMINRYVKETVE